MKKTPAPTAQSFGFDRLYAMVFGLFLGFSLWKFGNPVILDHKIGEPNSFSDWLNNPWPTHLAILILLPIALISLIQTHRLKINYPRPLWLTVLPIAWLGWQQLSETKSIDHDLSASTLTQFLGCCLCYFVGLLFFARRQLLPWLLAGLLAFFTYGLIRAVDQHLFEFPATYQVLSEGQRTGWTNFPPESITEMRQENIIVNTNGADVVNPIILAKFQKGRVNGTLVYPNALAGLILLLFPAAIVLAFSTTRTMKPMVRYGVIGLVLFLGTASFIWTGSKLGWLIALLLGGLCVLRLDWSVKMKWGATIAVFVLGLAVFAVRFHSYFAAGATSVGARFDYWHAAVQTTIANPVFGTGPGTFQRPYAQLKSPDAEMARLAHNDYLEQFSDSGIPAGLLYATWIVLALFLTGKKVWKNADPLQFAIFIGVLGWFIQGLGEFELYVPALAWTAFTLLGVLVGTTQLESDRD